MVLGYRVIYGTDAAYLDGSRIRAGRTVMMTLAAGFVFFSMVYRFWPEGEMVLEKLTSFPGFREIHRCLNVLVMELQCGTSLDQAVTAFCRDVVQLGMANAA